MMPNVSAAIRRFERTMQFQLVVKTVTSSGDVAETSLTPGQISLWFEGTLQPIHPREVDIKPEGQRQFKWWSLLTDLDIPVDNLIKDINGFIFRVMNKSDWGDGGFFTYQIIEGPGL